MQKEPRPQRIGLGGGEGGQDTGACPPVPSPGMRDAREHGTQGGQQGFQEGLAQLEEPHRGLAPGS